ncbi:hypothetical protein PspLS_08425 [Pyricularia sp. CBS 133598]|nr:hypothetical protein PspLS_08425 [Pyricularia sp. CBS 133598]
MTLSRRSSRVASPTTIPPYPMPDLEMRYPRAPPNQISTDEIENAVFLTSNPPPLSNQPTIQSFA